MNLADLIGCLTRPGHPVSVSRRALVAGAAALAALTVWAAGTGCYFLFRDDVATYLIARQSATEQAYEERIRALRVHLDRLASQDLLDRDGMDKRLAELVARSAQLESRQSILERLADSSAGRATAPEERTGAIPMAASPRASRFLPSGGPYASEPAKPKPLPESFELRLRGGPDGHPDPRERVSERRKPARAYLTEVQHTLGEVETSQIHALSTLLDTSETRASRLRDIVREVGLDPERLQIDAVPRPAGGPFVPFAGEPPAGVFDALLDRVQASVARRDHFTRVVRALPVARPTPEADLTSGYGYRIDPFTRGPAMHTGLDFRAEYGTPVHAGGPGEVIGAEYAGGYGNMVEIDHGHGVTTRYAHLSSIAVAPGQTVAAGALIGRAGSTGRSTGAHLHYETRIDGEAVDPQRFLRAGSRLAAAPQLAR